MRLASRPRRAPRRIAAGPVAVAVAAAGATTGLALLGDEAGDGSAGAASRAGATTATAPVERRDLVDRETFAGTLGYAGERSVAAGAAGTVTRLPAEGATVRRGEPLYELDGRPTAYLMYGERPAWRALKKGTEGPDVRQLERNLAAMGYDPNGAMTVDEEYDSATAAAVRRWQDARGVRQTGAVARGEVAFLPGPRRVGEHRARVGATVAPGAEVMGTTSTRRIVTVDLEADRQDLVARGGRVHVRLPSGRTVRGRIAAVGRVARKGKDDDSSATVTVTIALASGARAGRLDQAPVEVDIAKTTKRDTLAVPIAALLAREGGGYAVEVVEGGRRRLVPVRTGVFANGYVAVAGRGLREGARVAVPE